MGLVLAYFAVRSVICYHHLLADVLDLFVFFVELISYYLHTKKKTDKNPTTKENKNTLMRTMPKQ